VVWLRRMSKDLECRMCCFLNPVGWMFYCSVYPYLPTRLVR